MSEKECCNILSARKNILWLHSMNSSAVALIAFETSVEFYELFHL